MKPIIAALVAFTLLPMPLAAQTLTVLLPSITFPDGTLTPSTKGCEVTQTTAPVCKLTE
jgi:hypothetical protein